VLEDQLVLAAGNSLWNKASSRLVASSSAASVPEDSAAILHRFPSAREPRTQTVTANDLLVGQIRIPIAFKALLPADRQLTIRIRGEDLICGWNPQSNAGRQRSGLLRPPGEALRRLVAAGERLTLSVEDGDITLR
jgi:hypothetical protein